MIRVKDHEKSIKFYQDNFGMKLKRVSENPNAQFNLYFLGYGADGSEASSNSTNPQVNQEGLLELTWNYGTEKDPNFKYHDGNSDPQGFGHICVTVDDIEPACDRLEKNGVKFAKKLMDGRMHNLAFALGEIPLSTLMAKTPLIQCLDPDGYRIEILQNEKTKPRANW